MEQSINQTSTKINTPIRINKHDSKYLSKAQTRKAQFLYENDYFIWNEAEMYLRYHELFSRKANSDLLYDNICKTTRVVFNLIHDVHFSNTGSNVAYLNFYEVLDAWGAMSEYLKQYESFPSVFIDWFESIFDIYKVNDQSGDYVVSYKIFNLIYSVCGLDLKRTNEAYKQITSDGRYKLTFERILTLLKDIVVRDEFQHFSHFLVPKLQDTILLEREEKTPKEVLRNYDYEKSKNVYSNLSDWQSFDLDEQSTKFSQTANSLSNRSIEMKDAINFQSHQSNLMENVSSINSKKDSFIINNNNIDSLNPSSGIVVDNKPQEASNRLIDDERKDTSSSDNVDKAPLAPVFNLKEFKREFKNEFKRSTNNINRILSKSINTLDLLMEKSNSDNKETANGGHSNLNISSDSLQTHTVSYRIKQLNNQFSDNTRNKIDPLLQSSRNKSNNETKLKTIDLKSLSNYTEQQKNRTLSESPRRHVEKSSQSNSNKEKKQSSSKELLTKKNHESKIKISSDSSSSSSVSYSSYSKLSKKNNSSFSKHNTSLLANKMKQLDLNNRHADIQDNDSNAASSTLNQNSKSSAHKSSTRMGRVSKEHKESEADDEQKAKPYLKETSRTKFPFDSNGNINKSPIHYKIRSSTPKTWLDKKAANKIDIKRNLNQSTNESETLVNGKKLKAKSKPNRSFSSNEPYKSIMNAITLSSLDTLNDIDSEDPSYLIGDVDVYEQPKSYRSKDYLYQNDESITATSNLMDHHQDIEFYKNDEQKMYVEQDWSYSLNSTLLSVYDQKLIGEIIRKLKPYVRKCVRKEVKNFFEKHINKDCLNSTWSYELKKDLFNSSILAKIGDF